MHRPRPKYNTAINEKRRKKPGNTKCRNLDTVLILACITAALLLLTRPLSGKQTFIPAGDNQQTTGVEPEDYDYDVEPLGQPSLLQDKRDAKVRDLAKRPNELGKVPIIMYHVIGEVEGEWARTADNFRNDLKRFYELGYSLVPLQSYLSGNMDLPEGVSPLIITFDDATAGQFRLITKKYVETSGAREILEHKIPDPNSAVGILLEFSSKHPEFGYAATFYVDFPVPFDVPDEVSDKLNFLTECGMEIGNHTYNHRNLSDVPVDVIEMELGKQSNEIEQITGSKALSLALPYGGYPRDSVSKRYLMSGEYDEDIYLNLGILLVGAEPALSPYHKSFNPAAIPRIRGSEEELPKWLNYLERSGTRYVSDGKPDSVTVLESNRSDICDACKDTYDIVVLSDE